MSLILARIDDRLIHGQVIVGWARYLDPEVILVVSDLVAEDPKQAALFRLAAPASLIIHVFGMDQAVSWLNTPEAKKKRVMILFPSPREAAGLVERGIELKSINIGGLRYEEGKHQVMKAVSLSQDDINYFRTLSGKGIELEVRPAFSDEKKDLNPFLIQ